MSETPTQFSDLKLDPKVLQAIAEAGYDQPTPIQLGAIPPALEGRDVLGIAQTGTGKTAGFTLPMITLLGRGRARARMPRSLVLCPTRELAAQVAENFDTYSRHTRLTKALLIGGVSFAEQDKLIDRGVDVLIATPGRLLDHFERGKLLLNGVQIMVVDEADRMLDMGFIPDIERIFTLTPFTRQTLFFSATMAPEIERITDTFLHAPARIEVARQATASETIEQRLIEITPTRKDQTAKQKRELLRAVIDAEGEALKNAIIFCNRKTEVDIVAKSLKAHGYDAAPIHGDLDQSQRTRTLEGFREGTLRFLVASDVAARGLDIPAVSHVFNFDLPSHAEDYVHRIGRTGRAGREGTAISLAVPLDEKYLAAIESLLKKSLPRAAMPEGFALSEAAKSAPRPREDRGSSRSRSRGGRDRRDDHAQHPRHPVAETNPPREETAEAPAPKREETRREEPRRDDRRTPHRDTRPDPQRGNGRAPERRDDRHHNERRPAIIGLGDHVPDFLTRSFHTALASTLAGDAEAATGSRTAAEAGTPPSRTSRSRSRPERKAAPGKQTEAAPPATVEPAAEAATTAAPVAEPPAQTTTASEAPAAAVPAEPAPTEPAAITPDAPAEPVETVEQALQAPTAPEALTPPQEAEAPKPARAPRKRRTRADDAAAAAQEGAMPEEAASDGKVPPQAKAASRTRAAPKAKAPAKPRTTRSRKTATTTADEDAAPGAEPAEADAPAPRRTRSRRKPEPAPTETAPTETAPADSSPADSDAAPVTPTAAAPVIRDEA